MTRFPAGTVAWARDPTDAHPQRPVVVLSHEHHPFGATQCTVMCAGTSAGDYDHPTPELRPEHLTGISFSETTYLEPWAIYTVEPGVVNTGRAVGELTDEGIKQVKIALVSLFKV